MVSELDLLSEYGALLAQEKATAKRKDEIKALLVDMGSQFCVLQESKRDSVDAKKLKSDFPQVYSLVVTTKVITAFRVKV